MLQLILLIIGFILLIKGADVFVDGSSSIAKHFNIPPLLIGLTIVAFGTSAPEAAVSISATLSGNNGIAVGNVLGSNIFNISFIVGIAAIMSPLKVSITTIKREIPLTLISAILLIIFVLDTVFAGQPTSMITRGEGLVLLIFFLLFLLYILESMASHKEASLKDIKDQAPTKSSIGFPLIKTIGGIAVVIIGGKMVVSAGVAIATYMGLSETLIGLTIIAIGTSLPELVTSVVAAHKKEADIAIGNIVGSNIFNIFFILGISAVIKPIVLTQQLQVDLLVNLALTLMIYFFSRSEKTIVKWEGVSLLLMYLVYMVYLVVL